MKAPLSLNRRKLSRQFAAGLMNIGGLFLCALAIFVPSSAPAPQVILIPPTLSLSRQGDDIVLTVSNGVPAARFKIFVSEVIDSNANWTAVSTNQAAASGMIVYTNSGVARDFPQRFYRSETF